MKRIKESNLYIIIVGILLVVISLVVLVGFDWNKQTTAIEQTTIQPNTITEQHTITAIEGNDIYGENVSGTGEGIYYTRQDFIKLGLDVNELAIGDTVLIGWNEENYINEDWDQVALLELVQ